MTPECSICNDTGFATSVGRDGERKTPCPFCSEDDMTESKEKKAKKPAPERRSSKEMVKLAQAILRETARENTTNPTWTRNAARSLAASVLSQADPND